MKFKELQSGDTFDFVGGQYPSFFRPCRKVTSREYTDGERLYRVGSINAIVYHVNEVTVPTLEK